MTTKIVISSQRNKVVLFTTVFFVTFASDGRE